MAINGRAVALVALGSVVAYSGVRGKQISGSFRSVLMGESPVSSPAAHTITGIPLTGSGAGYSFGPNSAIGQRAAMDVGHPYDFGGWYYNPKGWDCSSAVNWWLSRFGKTLPGGISNYDGRSHGPVVANYQLWSGAYSIPRNQVQSGDLVLFGGTHMGIATSGDQFVSAQNPANGTAISGIDGFGSGTPNFKRVK
jgi:NlpC/P60 family